MEGIDEYLLRARRLDVGGFVMAYRHLFLLKHPKSQQVVPASWSRDLDGATRPLELRFDPAADRMQLAAIKKKERNGNPGEFSIGRASTCDVVLRFAFISKLHAQLTVDAHGKLSLLAHSSTSSTSRNGRPLQGGHAEEVQIGDMLSFGHLDLELCDAERLHRVFAGLKDMRLGGDPR